MQVEERQALHRIYSEHQKLIAYLCRDVARQCSDKAIQAQDLQSESYILLRQILVDYDCQKGSLKSYISTALKSRLQDYVKYRRGHADLQDAAPPYNNEPAAAKTDTLLPTWIDVDSLALDVIEAQANEDQADLKAFWSRLRVATRIVS